MCRLGGSTLLAEGLLVWIFSSPCTLNLVVKILDEHEYLNQEVYLYLRTLGLPFPFSDLKVLSIPSILEFN